MNDDHELQDLQYQQHVNSSLTKTWDYIYFWKFQLTHKQLRLKWICGFQWQRLVSWD